MQKNLLISKNNGIRALSVFAAVIIALLLIISFSHAFLSINYFLVHVDGTSMEGTLHDGDYVYAIHSSSPRRGDIVIIDTGAVVDGKKKIIIKRVIALEGDTVELKAGVLYLNGEKVDEPYIDPAKNIPTDLKLDGPIPEGHMFFMGDNRKDSDDCRTNYGHSMKISKTIGVVADWSMSYKSEVTAFNKFLEFKWVSR